MIANIFKNMQVIEDFYKTYKIKNNQKIYDETINLKVKFKTFDIVSNDIKYFELISHNYFDNSYENELNKTRQENESSLPSSRSIDKIKKNLTFNSGIYTVPSSLKNSLFGNDIKILKEDTRRMLEKYSIKSNASLNYVIALTQEQKEKEDLSLDLKFKLRYIPNSENHDKNKYSFYLYAFNSSDMIVEKIKFDNINVSDLKEIERDYIFKKKLNVEEIKISDIFEVIINGNIYDSNFNIKSRKIKIVKTEYGKKTLNELYVQKEYFNFLKSVKIIENFNNRQTIEEKNIDIKNFLTSDEFELIFEKEYKSQEEITSIDYDLLLATSQKNTFLKKYRNSKLQTIAKNPNSVFFERIKKDVSLIENKIKDNLLQIKISLNSDFETDLFYSPIISDILIAKKSILESIFLDRDLKRSLLKSNRRIESLKSLKEIILYTKDQNYQNLEMKLIFKNELDNTNFAFFQKIEKEFSSIGELQIYKKNTSNIVASDFSNNTVKYSFDLNKFNNIDNQNVFKSNSVINDLIKNYDLNLDLYTNKENNIDKILSETDKETILGSIDINKFYLVTKKNVKYFNISQDSFQILEIKDLNSVDNIFIDDNESSPNFKEKIESYSNIKNKHVSIEAKILSIPSSLFYKNVSAFSFKQKIKEIYLENIQNTNLTLPSDYDIDNLYDIFQKINQKGIIALNQNEVEELFYKIALNSTWAKSDSIEIKKLENNSFYSKEIIVKTNIETLSFDEKTNSLKGSIVLNVEELNSIGIEKNKILEIIYDSLRYPLKGFYYKKNTNSNYPDADISDTILKYENSYVFKEWSKESSNEFIKEINENISYETIYLNKNILEIKITLELKKMPKLLRLLSYIKNYKQMNLNKNLYQKISLSGTNIQITDVTKNINKNINVSFRDQNNCYFFYNEITKINTTKI